MSGKAMSWSRTIRVGSSSAKQVLRELCICQNEQTGQCTLSIKALIEITELSETTVLKALAFLKEKGFVRVEKIKTKNGWANSYSFPLIGASQKTEGTPRTEDTPNYEGTQNIEGEGTPRTEDTGTPKTRDLKKEEKNIKNTTHVDAPQVVDEKADDEDFTLSNEPAQKAKPKSIPCPYMKIIELYHQILPMLPGVQIVTTDRQAQMRARWKFFVDNSVYTTEADILKLFRTYFELVRSQNFLLGRDSNSDRPWRANFDWLLKEKNFTKVWEKTYVRK